MDWIQKAYTVQMRFYRGSAPVEVRWFRAAKDAQLFRGPNVFVSRWQEWSKDPERNYVPGPNDVGEVGAPPAGRDYDNGPNTLGYLGKSRCGSNSAWAAGGVPGVDAPLPLADDGTSACCGAITRPAMAGILIATGLLVTVFLGVQFADNSGSPILTAVTSVTTFRTEGIDLRGTVGTGHAEIHLLAASPTQTGAVTAGTQVFFGDKTFASPNGLTVRDSLTDGTVASMVAYTPTGSQSVIVWQVSPAHGTSPSIGGMFLGTFYAGGGGLDALVLNLGDATGYTPYYSINNVPGQYGTKMGLGFNGGIYVGGTPAVGTSDIVDGSITYEKLQDEAPLTLLGNPTIGPEHPSEIPIGAGLAIVSGALVATGGGGVADVAHGGTGRDTLTNHAVLLGADTVTLGSATVGVAGRVLIDQGAADPEFVAMSGDAGIDGFGDLVIQPAAVTYSKMQHVAALSLLGNPSGADTVTSAIGLGAGLAFGAGSISVNLSPTDIPAISASKITSGTLALAVGGTGANLSGTGGVGQYVTQSRAGGAFTVGVIAPADVPTISGGKIGSGTVGLAVGGTGTDLSATGGTGKLLFQETVGGAVTVRTLAPADIPALSAAKITSGLLSLAVGGTGADLSATGGGNTILAQPVLGGAVVPTSLAAMLDALGGISGSFG